VIRPIHIRAVDPGIRKHEAEIVLDNDHPRPRAQNLARFRKHEFDDLRIFLRDPGEPNRFRRWRDA